MQPNDLLARIRELDKKATPTPWAAEGDQEGAMPGKDVLGPREDYDLGEGPIKLMMPLFFNETSARNAELIAEYRNTTPRLAAALEAVLELCEELHIDDGLQGYEIDQYTGANEHARDIKEAIHDALGVNDE